MNRRRIWGRLFACLLLLNGQAAWAEKAILADGRVLEGRLARIEGIAVNPAIANGAAQQANPIKSILMCDDDLRRTMVGLREVSKFDSGPPPSMEHFRVKQRVAENGAPVASIGPITRVGNWDDFGRRSFGMIVGGKEVVIVQGLTEITPVWSKVESLQVERGAKYLWDMRIATSTIPRTLLNKILSRQINPKNPDERLKLVRFYMQGERFPDAEAELQQVIKDFKNLPNLQGLNQMADALHQLAADRLVLEIDTRKKAGQYRLADRMLRAFPTANVSGKTLEGVRDKIEANMKLQKRGEAIIAALDEQIGKIKDPAVRKQLKPLRDEIQQDLFVATLDRMATFARLADDKDALPEAKVALAISGWLIGANDATDNLQTALSLAETRNVIRSYLAAHRPIDRNPLLESLGSQQAASPKYVALLLSHMKPPVATEPQPGTPGLFKLEIHGHENEPDVTYFVQLPPEYDPYVKYPTIVTLHAAGTSAEQQIDWWAGVSREAAEAAAKAEMAKAEAAKEDGGNKERDLVIKAAAEEERARRCGPDPADEKAAAEKPKADDAKPSDAKPEQGEGGIIQRGMRLGQASRQGYIVIAPAWTKPHQIQYEYSAREHAAVLGALRDALKRFSIDTDRVFISGHSMGGDAAWDMALAHPDLWAGVIPIIATSGRYVERYWPNAERVPFYFVAGEFDGNKTVTNGPVLDRVFTRPAKDPSLWDITYVEYQGRGHENFSDEVLRIFDWMGRKHRDFFPQQFKAVTMRSWDNFFWCVELNDMPAAQMIEPASWPPRSGTLPFAIEMKKGAANNLIVSARNAKVTVWLSPEWVSFDRPIDLSIGGTRVGGAKGAIKPSIATMLEDARTRADRQHPFWAKVER